MRRMYFREMTAAAFMAFAVVCSNPSQATILSGLIEFSTDADGNFFNGSVWNTRGGDSAVNLWVIKGVDREGVFVNGPSDSEAGIAIPLSEGEYTFVIYGNQGGSTPHHGLNLFFNGNRVTPRISVFGPTQTSPDPPFPPFATNSSASTLTLGFDSVAAANTLAFRDRSNLVELIDYRFADFAVYNMDRVSQLFVGPDGTADFIGQFTLRVTGVEPEPEPTGPVLTGLIEFSTDTNGNFFNGSVWNTRGRDSAVNLWVISGADRHGPFINGPGDAQAGIALRLTEGDHTFTVYGNPGGPTPHHGLNLFFNGETDIPGISVFGETQISADPPFPAFGATGGRTLTMAFAEVPGANTLVFRDGGLEVELIEYRWADPLVYNLDRVSQTLILPDGASDFIGQFTLRVRQSTEPPLPSLTGLIEFSTDSSGNFFNGSVWNTRGGDTAVNLWVAKGSDLQGPLANGPSDSEARISITLEPGTNDFVIFGNPGGPTPHHGLNLFFNGDSLEPGISVFGPTQTSPEEPFPPFSVNNSPSTLTLGFQPAAGAGTLVYQHGKVRVELIDYRWAEPPVYDIDRISQMSAVPGAGSDFIGRFTLLVAVERDPTAPIAHIALSPQVNVPGNPHPFVVACEGEAAQVTLDGRGSSDPENDPLTYSWFVTGSATPFATTSTADATARVGVHSVTLVVSDGQSADTATLVFEVIGPAQAAAQIDLVLDTSGMSRKFKQPLETSLQTAVRSLASGNTKLALGELEAFRNKVQAQITATHGDVADRLLAATDALIAALENCEEAGN